MVRSRKHLVALTGAGISAESGIPTFRGLDGLWHGHRVETVASPDGWHRNPGLVLEFYNQRRRVAAAAQPNRGHEVLAELENELDVTIITQNIDQLHERAGSSRVVHLHGLISQSRSTVDPRLVYDIEGWELKMGDLCEKGSQLRPNIVWFGEAVPRMAEAVEICQQADFFAVIGTSLGVYPAAGLIYEVPAEAVKLVIDPEIPQNAGSSKWVAIGESASTGVLKMRALILQGRS
jgi:NAD-dependent deacetylase